MPPSIIRRITEPIPIQRKSVRWGDQSWDEMMVGFFDLAIPITTDPASVLVGTIAFFTML